ncbi:MAG: type VI secretion system lipoprotein TssJ [Pseudomonadota bacterium]
MSGREIAAPVGIGAPQSTLRASPSAPVAYLVVLLLMLMGACAAKPPKDIKLKSQVIAAESLNPSRRGTSQPVQLHIYYLKQDEAFSQASFSDLVTVNAPAIAGDVVRHEARLIGPGETAQLDTKFDPETRYIGVVAAFTRIGNASWRSLIEVPKSSLRDKLNPFSGKKLEIELADTTVTASIVKD